MSLLVVVDQPPHLLVARELSVLRAPRMLAIDEGYLRQWLEDARDGARLLVVYLLLGRLLEASAANERVLLIERSYQRRRLVSHIYRYANLSTSQRYNRHAN